MADTDVVQLSPAEAAQALGIAAETLRYWERAGLLAPITRDGSGHRRYQRSDLEFLDVVRCLRVTGMSIAAVRRFTDLLQLGDEHLGERIALLHEHREHVVSAIATQEAALTVIETKIRVQEDAYHHTPEARP